MKPYRIDFSFNVKEQASIYVAADDPEKAKAGAMEILLATDDLYSTAEIVAVEEVKKEKQPTIN